MIFGRESYSSACWCGVLYFCLRQCLAGGGGGATAAVEQSIHLDALEWAMRRPNGLYGGPMGH